MNNNLLKIYCGILKSEAPYLEILNPNFGFKKRKNIFGDKDIFDDFTSPIFNIVSEPSISDFLLIPHNYFQIKNDKQYISNFISLSEKYSKKIIIFAIGDSTEHIDIPNSLILRMSQYESRRKINEIIIPAYAADLSYGKPILYRTKQSMPSIGFCGWADIKGFLPNLSFLIKNFISLNGSHRKGLYFRKKTINNIKKSLIIKPNLIVRSAYGASESTTEMNPKIAREEYRNNMIESDFILAPKGDGNYSARFYEALSLGRVPILIDTDCPLPLSKEIDYSKFILKISYKDIGKLDKIVADFYKKLSNEEWINMQKAAKNAFDQYLRIDVFFRNLFKNE